MLAGRSGDCSEGAVPERDVREPSFQRNPAALFRRLLDGVLVLGPAADEPLQISAPGDVVWELLAEPLTQRALTEDLSEIFGAPVNVVRADIEPVLTALIEVHAIRVVAGPE